MWSGDDSGGRRGVISCWQDASRERWQGGWSQGGRWQAPAKSAKGLGFQGVADGNIPVKWIYLISNVHQQNNTKQIRRPRMGKKRDERTVGRRSKGSLEICPKTIHIDVWSIQRLNVIGQDIRKVLNWADSIFSMTIIWGMTFHEIISWIANGAFNILKACFIFLSWVSKTCKKHLSMATQTVR